MVEPHREGIRTISWPTTEGTGSVIDSFWQNIVFLTGLPKITGLKRYLCVIVMCNKAHGSLRIEGIARIKCSIEISPWFSGQLNEKEEKGIEYRSILRWGDEIGAPMERLLLLCRPMLYWWQRKNEQIRNWHWGELGIALLIPHIVTLSIDFKYSFPVYSLYYSASTTFCLLQTNWIRFAAFLKV